MALALIERHGVGGRDAVHAATALVHGIPQIVSPDPDLDGIEALNRWDPRRFA
jgi:predicted nucleic acid-binding protein